MSMISDHNPCIASINLLKAKSHNTNFVKMRQFNENALQRYGEELIYSEVKNRIEKYLSTDPNTFFDILNQTLIATHSVESPSMVDPQWDIWY